MTWQPIETAPRDGTPILIYVGPDEQCVGEWSAIVGAFYHGEEERLDPTHWQPLPEPPGSETPKRAFTVEELAGLAEAGIRDAEKVAEQPAKPPPEPLRRLDLERFEDTVDVLRRYKDRSGNEQCVRGGTCTQEEAMVMFGACPGPGEVVELVVYGLDRWNKDTGQVTFAATVTAPKPPPKEIEPIDVCPTTGGEHAWLDTSTNDGPGQMCQKCGMEG